MACILFTTPESKCLLKKNRSNLFHMSSDELLPEVFIGGSGAMMIVIRHRLCIGGCCIVLRLGRYF